MTDVTEIVTEMTKEKSFDMRARMRILHPDWSEEEVNQRIEHAVKGLLQMVDISDELQKKTDTEIAELLMQMWEDTSLFAPESAVLIEAAERLGLPESWWEEEKDEEGKEEKSKDETA